MKMVVIGDCTLYHGDALEILPTIEKVDCIASDVPYLITSGGNTTGEMGGKFAKDVYDNSGDIIGCKIKFEDFMTLLSNKLDRGHAYIMVNNRNVQEMLNEAREGRV